ncbi:hypothetical protein EAG_08714 [Camponotus floridanus]|uniref:Uncharacterized protein n=1 Tax=Camponotus floridanus TaxID=104421 RepID=E2A824_CAMFO|nr:hypothetical protein EAG_08714 [Camponotus floridanus]
MPAAGAAVPAVVEGAGQLEDLDEPPEPRARGGGGRTGLMKPLVVLALPGMYLFYKYSQYRREQRELSRRRVTERELQHLHHKISLRLHDLGTRYPVIRDACKDVESRPVAALNSPLDLQSISTRGIADAAEFTFHGTL